MYRFSLHGINAVLERSDHKASVRPTLDLGIRDILDPSSVPFEFWQPRYHHQVLQPRETKDALEPAEP